MLDIIFLAFIAAFIGFRLYNALGRKDFEHGNVVHHPAAPPKVIETSYVEIKPATDDSQLEEKFGIKLAEKIREIRKIDPSFTVESFLSGAKKAFEIIVKAFSNLDKATLKPLLSKEVYNSFSLEIDSRAQSQQIQETTLVAIPLSSIKEIILSQKYVRIAVQIVSEQVHIIKDKKGVIIEGDPSQIDRIEEIWTFGRDLTSQNPNWELLETAAA